MSGRPLTEKGIKKMFVAVDAVAMRRLHGEDCECPTCRPDILENRSREENDE